MRRTVLVLVLLVAALGVVAAGCGQEQEQTATPETVEGELTTETTETETTETPRRTRPRRRPTETDEDRDDGDGRPRRLRSPKATQSPAKQVFLGTSACGSCHTLADAGSNGQIGPNLDESQPDYELALDRVTNGQGEMPSFSNSLSEQQIADVSAYVSSVAVS